MFRGALTLLLLLLATAPAAAGESPSGQITTLRGTLEVSRRVDDIFTLRVITLASCGFPELLAEKVIQRGSFRVLLPVPDGESFALVTSERHEPVVQRFRPGKREPRFRKAIRPREWRTVEVTVRHAEGVPVPRAAFEAWCIPPALHRYVELPWLRYERIAGADGVAAVPFLAGGQLRVEAAGARFRSFELGRKPEPLSIHRWPRPGHLYLRGVQWPVEGTPPALVDRWDLNVEFRAHGRWVPPPKATDRDGRLPAVDGWDAARVTAPGYRPWLLLREEGEHVRKLGAALDVGGPGQEKESTLTVNLAGTGVPIAADHWCGTCMTRYSGGVARVAILDADGCDVTGSALRNRWSSGVPPGRYVVRVRGSLGRPVERTVDLPEGTDVKATVTIGGGSGIRLLVRGESGHLAESVSFRVLDRSGRPIEVEYTDAALSKVPAFSHEGRTLRDVPAHGVIRIEPGEWTVEFLDGEAAVGSFAVRCWPEVITRLDTRARRATRGTKPAKTVRLR